MPQHVRARFPDGTPRAAAPPARTNESVTDNPYRLATEALIAFANLHWYRTHMMAGEHEDA